MPERDQLRVSAFLDAPVAVAVLSPAGELWEVNRAFCDLAGRPAEELRGTRLQTLLVTEDEQGDEADPGALPWGDGTPSQAERLLLRADRPPVPVLVDAALVAGPDGAASHVVVQLQDVTARRAQLAALAHQALHDPLTGLPNRVLFLDRLTHALDRQERRHVPVAVLYCDLDGFKHVNDRYGHAGGDEVLVEFARRLRDVQRPGDTAARLAGDEFAVLCEDAGTAEATSLADRLRAVLREPVRVGDQVLPLTVSIGVASAGTTTTALELLQQADGAMYRAKHATRGPGHVRLAGLPPADDPG